MNELYEQNKAKGLIVVGVSDEGTELVEGFIKEFGVKFPIIISKNANKKYGVNGFPTAYILTPELKVFVKGHPMEFQEEQFKEVIAMVAAWPEGMPVTPEWKPLRSAWEGKRYGEVGKQLDVLLADPKLADQGKTSGDQLKRALTARVEGASEEVKALASGPDFLASQTRLEEIMRSFDGLAPANEATQQLNAFKKDKKVQTEITALKKLATLKKQVDAATRDSERKKLVPVLRAFATEVKGTHAAQRAAALLTEIMER